MALDGLSPFEALEKSNYAKIYEINARKGLKNKTVSDLEPGDKVRIKIAGMFSKGSEPQYSDKVYTVETVRGSTIHLNDGEVKKRYNLLKVPRDTQSSIKNIMKVSAEKAKVKKAIEAKNIEGAQIYAENSIRKKNEYNGKR
jgi:ribosomal protein L21E